MSGRSDEGVDHVDGKLAPELLPQATEGRDGPVVRARYAARERDENGWHVKLGGFAKRLLVDELRGLRCHGHRTPSNLLVEVMGASRLEEVVGPRQTAIRLARLSVGEGQVGNVGPLDVLNREVATRVGH